MKKENKKLERKRGEKKKEKGKNTHQTIVNPTSHVL